ncbi:GNAT family N-acetyltransferase [Kitasatospora viridis]|uniref:Putative acetyltransferase n=1 Tax=Kitasatospora viridis TaxID=281105 RepID=A0A561UIM6_9ACTN|nr:GNAT family N-acetyltransferase [Kitasatospora viridis]TWF99200.1 putative acetyltransferase [Kitasatospora viridis]
MSSHPADDLRVRPITDDEIAIWGRAVSRGFLRAGLPDAEELRRLRHVPGRALAAFEGERIVGTLRSMPYELTLPGGALLPASAITGVTVSQTHRRRGLLSRMMDRELAGARERGEAVAILIAAEYGIYGRFGFGPATRSLGWTVKLDRTGGLRADLPVGDGSVELISMTELAELGPELHERWRRLRPGAITRDEVYWRSRTGRIEVPGLTWQEPFALVHRDAGGTVTGLLVYQVEDKWDGPLADGVLRVKDFLALDLATETALWRYACSMDWVHTLVAENLGPDTVLPLLLTDPRAASVHEDGDFMWLRVLDVPAAFAARGYAGPGELVVEVTDRQGYAAGRWLLRAGADGTGSAEPSTAEPELALDAQALGSLYLGAETASRLAAAGLLAELRPGAAFALDRLLATPLRAWNPDVF